MKEMIAYHAAVYLRLSRDDQDIGGSKFESNSISSQREIIQSYVKEHEDIKIVDTFIDDGISGITFDRPEFIRMMKDVTIGRVNCIIVKDLSRFGRDYIESGRLIQKTLPGLGVRFIAVTDHFDSLTADSNESTLILPVKNFVNDSYCRDISQKVRSTQQMKREKGEFIGAFAVYGYQKDPDNPYRLIPDEYAAEIVKKIFAWKIDGMSAMAIADKLNGLGILSPMDYKKSCGVKFNTGLRTRARTSWSSVAVNRILTNEFYIGTMVQGKTEKINYKVNKSVEKPPKEWIRVAHTHQAIVPEEDFHNAARLLSVNCRAGRGKDKAHLFSGLLYCGDCKEAMIRRVNRYKGIERIYYICPTRNKGLGCTRHSIEEHTLKSAILDGINLQITLFMDKSKVLEKLDRLETDFEEIVRFDREIKRLRIEQEKYLDLRVGLYEDLKAGIINEDDFKSFGEIYEKQYKDMQEAIGKQEEMVKALHQSGVASGIRLEYFKKALEIGELDRNVLMAFVNQIFIYEDKRVRVKLKNQEPYGRLLMLADE